LPCSRKIAEELSVSTKGSQQAADELKVKIAA
jgi:hypothetical protein